MYGRTPQKYFLQVNDTACGLLWMALPDTCRIPIILFSCIDLVRAFIHTCMQTRILLNDNKSNQTQVVIITQQHTHPQYTRKILTLLAP